MSLANVLAVIRAARSIVLLGDPQQLEQPQKGTHPDGVGAVGARAHARRAADDAGRPRHLPAGNLAARAEHLRSSRRRSSTKASCARRPASSGSSSRGSRVRRAARSGSWTSRHDGNRTRLRRRGRRRRRAGRRRCSRPDRSGWTTSGRGGADDGPGHPRRRAVQRARRPPRRASRLARCARSAPSTSSRARKRRSSSTRWRPRARGRAARHGVPLQPESPERRDVARAVRGRSSSPSPRLFEPECRTPRQMELANALCRYRELARTFEGCSVPTLAPRHDVRPTADSPQPRLF